MLPEEIEHYFVATLVFRPRVRISKVRPLFSYEPSIPDCEGTCSPGSHPAVYLVPKSLDVFLSRQRFPKSLHIGGILVLGSKHANWNLDPLCIIGGNLSGMGFGCCRERCTLL